MRIKKEYVLREIANTWIVVPFGKSAVNFNGILTLNETGRLIWQKLEAGATEQDLVETLTQEYDVSVEKAQKDISLFIAKIREIDCIEDD